MEEIRKEFRRHAEEKGKQASVRARRQFNSACKKWSVSKTAQPGELKSASAQWWDVLVMGGFAHNRFEEIVFGGTTLEVLHHSPLPVLMMH
jgi:nucleotide-binding universal stress UspA family protein